MAAHEHAYAIRVLVYEFALSAAVASGNARNEIISGLAAIACLRVDCVHPGPISRALGAAYLFLVAELSLRVNQPAWDKECPHSPRHQKTFVRRSGHQMSSHQFLTARQSVCVRV